MARRNITQLAYDALTLEGGLFNAEWLAQVAHLLAPQQRPEDYGVPVGLVLRDEIARAWRIAQALWIRFHPGVAAGSGGALAATDKFVAALLEQVFGFSGLARQTRPKTIGERTFPISHALAHIPVLVAGYNEDIDDGQHRLGELGRRRSPFGLLQEYLNAADESLWGLVTNGLILRLVRDNVSLTRPAWLEADLERVFVEELFADFSALWLTIHASRFGRPGVLPTECPLEIWRNAGQQAGTRARDELRRGVKLALAELGQGFLGDSSNAALRSALVDGSVTAQTYFEQLLRMVYRIIFLITVEERGLLHPSGASANAAQLYALGYSLHRLRERAVRHSAHDAHCDLYAALKVSFRGLASGEPLLSLPALGGLFGSDQTPLLDNSSLQNRHLLAAIWSLAWISREDAAERVNWRDMGPEELGSVYESLLELVPQVGEGALTFRFAEGTEARGNARKLSGSYYTSDSLVQALLDSALEPLISRRKAERPDDEAAAILSISVIDPAVGSGHFLLSAARRLAAHLARARAQGQPSAAEHRRAVRDVVSHCLFGVDRNPMALELAKIALWLEAMMPDAPLSFLDTHLALGDALLGVLNPGTLAQGIPDDAYLPLTGDNRETCARLKQRNRDARKTLGQLAAKGGQGVLAFDTVTLATELARLDALPDDTLEAVSAKRLAWNELHKAQERRGLVEDLFVAAFLIRKDDVTEDTVPTTEHLLRGLTSQPLPSSVVDSARRVARAHHAFHWRDTFAHIFERGGFDCVLGNPPWETMSPDGKEFFSTYDPQVRFMAPDEQRAAFTALLERPTIAAEWEGYCRTLYTHVQFYKTSGRYHLFASGNLGKGDFNVYRMFVETALEVTRQGGYCAQFVPEGFYKGANAAAIRQTVFTSFNLHLVVGFVNTRAVWFPSVHQQFEFCLYVAQKAGATDSFGAAFRVNTEDRLKAIVAGRGLRIPVSLVGEFSPDALAVMEFSTQHDIEICQRMYNRHPTFGQKIEGKSYRRYMAEIHMGGDRALFTQNPDDLPLVEGRMIDMYDYRAKGYASGRGRAADWVDLPFDSSEKLIQPQWRVSADTVPEKLADRIHQYRVGFCDVVNPATEKCLVSALIPPACVCGHSVPTILFENGGLRDQLLWIGVANSFAMDFVVRKKVRLHMTYTILDSLPFPRDASTDASFEIIRRVFALCAVGGEMQQLHAESEGRLGQEIRGADELSARECLAAEINVLVARDMYGLTETELLHILGPAIDVGDESEEAFAVLRNREMREFKEFRTRRLIEEAWERLEQGAPRVGRAVKPRHRARPRAPYLPTSVPCCEAEAWLGGLACDVIGYLGPKSEPQLRLILSTHIATLEASRAADLASWTSKDRLDRLPQVLRWLRQLIGIPTNRDLVVDGAADLKDVPGDERTQALAVALVDAYRSGRAEASSRLPSDSLDAVTAPLSRQNKRL